MKTVLLAALVGMSTSVFAVGKLSLQSLLSEMTNADSATYLSSAPFKTRMWSSTDPSVVTVGGTNWFANLDCRRFVRVETNDQGRAEHVLLDAEGPGAVVRFWMTVVNIPESGILRIFVDGKKVIEGKSFDIVSGNVLSEAPLADSVAPQTPPERRGNDLYLPIPYAKSCKITAEYEEKDDRGYYYNIETRTYPADTEVESFSLEALAACKEQIARVNAELKGGTAFPLPKGCATQTTNNFLLAAGSEKAFSFSGPGAIREIALNCNLLGWTTDVPMPEDIVVVLDFDGERTVEMPVTAFFGVGPTLRSFQTRFCSFTNNVLRARWVMPYRETARVAVRCDSHFPLFIHALSVTSGAYDWKEGDSQHFYATRKMYRQIRTRENGQHRDLNYLTVHGRAGRLVGCGVTILNSAPIWWGEGDEKIYIDGERFPSYFGTGTEDHYGYAWSRPETFSHPFLAQPEGAGAMHPGYAVNLRHRVLDVIPFRSSLIFDMELWHWRDCVVDYETFCWYYQQ